MGDSVDACLCYVSLGSSENAVAIGGPEPQDSPELPLERSDLAPELRERLHDLRAELAALRKVLREVVE